MLYNVLPPLIFFMSLGGIIIVISRVVLRLRQQQLLTDLQSHVTRVSRTRLNKVQDLAGLLAPNQISVQSFKNRLTFLIHNSKESWQKMWQDISDWREKRRRIKVKTARQPAVEKIPALTSDSDSPDAPAVTAIRQPNSFMRNKIAGIAGKVKKTRLPKPSNFTAKTAAMLQAVKQKITSLSAHPSLRRKDQAVISTNQSTGEIDPTITADQLEVKPNESPKLRIINTDETPAPAPSSPVMATMGHPVKAGSLSQLFKKELKKSPLQEAAEALEHLQTKRAEDLLVPYIVKHPKDTDAYMMLGRAAINRHAWNEATEIFEQVIKLKPETEGCYAALGQAALEAGNLTKAIQTLQRAHDQNPQNVFVIKCLLQIASRMDNRPLQQSLNLELQQLEQSTVPDSQSVSSPQ